MQTHHNLLSGKIKNVKINRDIDYQVADSAEIDDKSCLAEGGRIGSNVKIVNSVLGEKVIVEDAAVVQNSVIRKGRKIDSQARISGAIIGLDCSIGKNVSIADLSVLEDETIHADINI